MKLKRVNIIKLCILGFLTLLLLGCSNISQTNNQNDLIVNTTYNKTAPEWLKSATIYQINTRQFTPQGTLRAAEQELTRLKALGIDIVWLMPIHPIGEKNRKGSLGSPYAVQDFFSVNP